MTKTAATKFQVRWRKEDDPDTQWSSPVDVGKDGAVNVPGLERVEDYVFQARAGSECGAWSDWVVQTFNMPNADPPPAVSSLAATPVADGVHLGWSGVDYVGTIIYSIERSNVAGSGYAERATSSGTAYTDPETTGGTYFYRVRAKNGLGLYGDYSNVVSSHGVSVDNLGDDVAAAQAAADAAQDAADQANAQLAAVASDDTLSPAEKPVVIRDYGVLTTEQAGIDAQATAYGITTEKTAYDNAVSALTSYLATLTDPVDWDDKSDNTTIVAATFESKFSDVYTQRQALLNKIYATAKSLADDAKTTALQAVSNGNDARAIAQANAPLVPNGSFKNGDDNWTLQDGWATNSSLNKATFTGASGRTAQYLYCPDYIPCAPGSRWRAGAIAQAFALSGSLVVRLMFFDSAQTYISGTTSNSITGSSGPLLLETIDAAPAAARYVRFEILANSESGTCDIMNCYMEPAVQSLDSVPDSSTRFAAAEAGAQKTNGKSLSVLTDRTLAYIGDAGGRYAAVTPNADSTEANLSFKSVLQLASNGNNLVKQGDWLSGSLGGWQANSGTIGLTSTTQPLTTALALGGPQESGVTNISAYETDNFVPVRGGEVLQFFAWGICRNGFDGLQFGVYEYDANKTYLRNNRSSTALTSGSYAQVRGKVQISSDAVYVRPLIWANGTSNGSNYAPTVLAYVLYRADAITIPGSGLTIGDQRNLLPTTWAGVRSVLSTSPISASVSGTTVTISVAAVTFQGGGGGSNISFGASSGSVTQATGTTVNYYCYYRDGTSSPGGSKTLNITTDTRDLAAYTDIWYLGAVAITNPSSAIPIGAPKAKFTVSTSNLTVSFANSTAARAPGTPSYLWEFGDGSRSTSTSPNHTYAAAGTYRVTLTARNSVGLYDSKSIMITVSAAATTNPPSASFTTSVSGMVASFTDTSTAGTNAIASRYWDFGDGTTSSATNPSHTYPASGDYSVTLTVSDSSGLSDSTFSTVTVTSGQGAGGGGGGILPPPGGYPIK